MKKLLFFLFLSCLFNSTVCGQELYDPEIFEKIEIDFYNDNWNQILTQSWNEQTKLREPATITYGDNIILDSVAVRFKGNSTFSIVNNIGNDKVPYNLDINDLKDQELLGYNKIKLANAFFDPTFIREAIAYNIYRKYMPASLSNHISLYVEGDFLGVYSNSESINKQFLKKHFDYSKGSFFKCDPILQFGDSGDWTPPDLSWYGEDSTNYQNRYELKSEYGWNDLVDLIEVIEFEPENIDQVLNVDRALWYMAVSNTIANLDSYPGFYIHNYYLFKHENGLWQFIPWDVSESFIGALVNSVSNDALINWDIFLDDENDPDSRSLAKALFSNPIYKKQYVAHIKTIIKESMNVDDIRGQIKTIQDNIKSMTAQDENAFFGFGDRFMESNVDGTTNIFFFRTAGIVSTIEDRLAYINSLSEFNTVDPVINEVNRDIETPDDQSMVTITANCTFAEDLDVMVSTNEWASHFKAYPMAKIADNEYSALLPAFPAETNVKYYVRAQNETSMTLMPARAEYEFYEYTVKSISKVEEDSKAIFQIIPNPIYDEFTVYFPEMNHDETISIYNELGQKVMGISIEKNTRSRSINFKDMSSGTYFLKLGTSKESYKLVKL